MRRNSLAAARGEGTLQEALGVVTAWPRGTWRAVTFVWPLLLLSSLFLAPRVPLAIKVFTGFLGVLAFLQPGEALVVMVGLLPLSHVVATRIWELYPLALSEVLVLAFLTGYLARRAFREFPDLRSGGGDLLYLLAWTFGLVVLTSALVQFRVVQTWHDDLVPYTGSFLAYLVRDYLTTAPDARPWDDGRRFVQEAALLIESVALVLISRRLCDREGSLGSRLVAMVAVGGTGAATINLLEAAQALVAGDPNVWRVRWSGFIPSIDSSGAFLLLPAFAAAGHVTVSSTGILGAVGTIVVVLALWLNGTRSAAFSGLMVGCAWLVWLVVTRKGEADLCGLKAVAGAAVAAVAAGLLVIVANPFEILSDDAYEALRLRLLLAGAAWRMATSDPLFGVGIAQYSVRYQEFAPPELLRLMPAADAHNYFLAIAAELGVVGFVTFVAFLGSALMRALSALQAHPDERHRSGSVAGVIAFTLTWLAGQPVTIPLIAYTYWILLGATSARWGADTCRVSRFGQAASPLRAPRRVRDSTVSSA